MFDTAEDWKELVVNRDNGDKTDDSMKDITAPELESEGDLSVRSKGKAIFAPWQKKTAEKVNIVTPKPRSEQVNGSSAGFGN